MTDYDKEISELVSSLTILMEKINISKQLKNSKESKKLNKELKEKNKEVKTLIKSKLLNQLYQEKIKLTQHNQE